MDGLATTGAQQQARTATRSALPFVAALAIFALAVLPFARSAGHGFIDCDDYDYVTVEKTPLVAGGVSWAGAKFAASDLSHGIWMPLTWASYMTDFSLFGGKPGAMHLHSLVLHGVNAVLVFILLLMVTRKKDDTALLWSAVCAVAWAVHPLRVESVAWIASRKDVLSFFFELLALICWVRSAEDGQDARPRRCGRFLVAALGFFVLATMAKPSAMTFPILALVLDWLVMAKWSVKRTVAIGVAGAWCVAVAILAAHAQKVGGATSATSVMPLWWKCVNACAAFGIYLKNTVWPIDLAPQCTLRWPGMPRFWWQGLVLSCVAGLCVLRWFDSARYSWRSGKGVYNGWPSGAWRFAIAGLLWFIIAWGPMSGISGFGLHAFADRFTYIPAVGISLALAGAGGMIGKLSAFPRKAVFALCILCCAVLGAVAWRQTGYWRDDDVLWSHTLEVDGDRNAYALRSLAMHHFEKDHDVKKVASLLGRVMEISEDAVGPVALMYVIALCEDGRSDEASKVLSRLQNWHDRLVTGGDPTPEGMGDTLGTPGMLGEAKPRVIRKSGNWDMAKATWMATQGNLMSVALGILDAIEKEHPDHMKVLYLRGLFAKWRGDNAEARRHWTRLVEHGRGEPYVKFSFVKKWLLEEQEHDQRKDASK